MIPFPPYEPDRSIYNALTTSVAVNCLPVADGWGPMPEFVPLSDALPAECKGLFYYRAPADGVITVIAGTASNLYKLDTSTSPYSWVEISQTTDAYSVPASGRWCFAAYGNTLIATNGADAAQKFDLTSGTAFADLGGSPPLAKYVAVVGDFVVMYNLDGNPNAMHWSGVNNSEFWTLGQRGCDIQVFPEGAEIQALVPVGQGAIVVQRDAMQNMVFTPASSYVFGFSSANSARGAIAPFSVVEIGAGNFLFLSEDGFFARVTGDPIGAERVDRTFLGDIDLDYLPEVVGVADPYNKIVWWLYQTVTGDKRMIGYDWQLNRWCYSTDNFQAAAAIATPGISWDGLANIYASIDDVTLPFDSRVFAGGRPVFAVINTDGKLAFMAGSNKAVELETGIANHGQGQRAIVRDGYVVSDCTDFTVSVAVATTYGGSFTYRTAVSPSSRSGRLPLRGDGFLHKYKMVIPSGATWSHLQGVEVIFERSGVS